MFSITKDGEPIGIPSKRNPAVNSIVVGWDGSVLFDLVENVAIAVVISDAKIGLLLDIQGMGDVLLVAVKILILSGLMKQPSSNPRS
jgi:hypothetical protein